MTETDVESTVRTLLSVAGLSPSEDEIAILVQAYPGHKAGIESLYAIPEVKYGAPGLVFNANPTFADWWS